MRRVVDVLPDGKQFDTAINDRLDGDVEKTVTLPADALPGASKLFVKIYPGTFSQVVEGLDGMLRMPSGCFEQTSFDHLSRRAGSGLSEADQEDQPGTADEGRRATSISAISGW